MRTRSGYKWNRVLMTVLTFVLVLAFSHALLAADTVVKIGNIIPLSGPSATVGEQGK